VEKREMMLIFFFFFPFFGNRMDGWMELEEERRKRSTKLFPMCLIFLGL